MFLLPCPALNQMEGYKIFYLFHSNSVSFGWQRVMAPVNVVWEYLVSIIIGRKGCCWWSQTPTDIV